MKTVREAIAAGNEAYMNAVSAGDGAAIAAAYTNDAVFYFPGMPPLQGPVVIAQTLGQVMAEGGITALILSTEEVDDLGDTAIEYGSYVMRAGAVEADKGRYVVVWKNTGAGWKIARDLINSSNPPA